MKKRWRRLTALTLALLLVLTNSQWAAAEEADPQSIPAHEQDNGQPEEAGEPEAEQEPAAQEDVSEEEPVAEDQPIVEEQPEAEYLVRIAAADTAAGRVYVQTNGEKHEAALQSEYSETVPAGASFTLEVSPNTNFSIETVKMDGEDMTPREVKDGVSTYLIENISKDILIEITYKAVQVQANEEIVQEEVTVKAEDAGESKKDETGEKAKASQPEKVNPPEVQTEEPKSETRAEETPGVMSTFALESASASEGISIPVTYSGLLEGVTGPGTIAVGYIKNTAPAIEGYRFVKATVNDTEISYIGIYGGQIYVSGDGESAIQLKEDHPVVLIYKEDVPEYSVTYTYDKEKGIIKGSNGKEAVDGKADADTEISFTAEPNRGYQVGEVKLNGTEITDESGVYKFKVSQECNIEVIFEKKDAFNVSIDTSAIEEKGLQDALNMGDYKSTAIKNGDTWTIQFNTMYLADYEGVYINYLGINGISIPLYIMSGNVGGIIWNDINDWDNRNPAFHADLGNGMEATLLREDPSFPDQKGGDFKDTDICMVYTLTVTNVSEDLNIQMNARSKVHGSSELMVQSAQGVDIYYWNNEADELQLITSGAGIPSGRNHYLFVKTRIGYKPSIEMSGDQAGQPSGHKPIKDYNSGNTVYQRGKEAALAKGCSYVCWFDKDYNGKHESGISFKAQPVPVSVVYNLDGGGGNITDDTQYTIQDGKNVIPVIPETPAKDGVVFDGWKCDLTGDEIYFSGDSVKITEENFDKLNNNTVTFTAQWVKEGEARVPYTIQHWVESDSKTGEYTEEKDKTRTYQGVRGVTAFAIPSEEIIDRGYSLDPSVEGFQQAGEVTADGKLVLKLYYSMESYQISYNLDNGSLKAGEENPASYRKNTDTFTLNNPVRDGYMFDGWSGTDIPEGSYSGEVTITKNSKGNREYTAHWKKEVVVKAGNVTVEYGASAEEIKAACTVSVTGLPEGVEQEDLKIEYQITDEDQIKDAKTYEGVISAAVKDAPEDWAVTYTPGNVTVSPKAVQVTLKNQEKQYGQKDPELEYIVETPLSYSETQDILKIAVSRDGAGKKEDAGSYDITGTYDNPNYNVTFSQKAKLTISQAPLTVTAHSDSRAYGNENPKFKADVEGVIDNQVVRDKAEAVYSKITYECEAVKDSPLGAYDIVPELTLTEHGEKNYTVSTVKGSLAITQKETDIVITAPSLEMVYGEEIPREFTAKVTGGAADTLPDLTYTVALEGGQVKDAGTYNIIVTVDPEQSKNYKIATVPGTLTIKPAQLTVAFDSNSSVYGEPVSELGYQVSGQQYGEDPAQLVEVKNLHVAGTATGSKNAGSYDITGDVALMSGALGSNGLYNYAVEANKGTYTVGKRPVTVTADRKTQVYGDPEKELTWTAQKAQAGVPDIGLLDDDELRGITGKRVIREQNKGIVKVGWYDVDLTWEDGKDPNYDVLLIDNKGEYTIEKRPIILTVISDKEITYGDRTPSFDVSAKLAPGGALDTGKGGIMAADKQGISLAATYAVDASRNKYDPAGTYPVTAGWGEVSGFEGVTENYNIAGVKGATYTVKQREIEAFINPSGKVYNKRPNRQDLTGEKEETLSSTIKKD